MPLDIFTDLGDVAAYARSRPPAPPGLEATFGEAFSAAFEAAAGTIRDFRVADNQFQHVNDWIAKFEAATGNPLRNPEYEITAGNRAKAYDALRKAYDGQRAIRPDLDLPPPPTAEEARSAAIDLERRRESALGAVLARPHGIGAGAGAVLGGMGAAALDPVNLASMAVGVPPAAGILSTMLRLALIGGVSQTAISASSYGVNREINPDYGAGDAALEVLGAAAGGAVLGGGIKGLALLWSRIAGRRGALPVTDSLARETPPADAEQPGPAPTRPEPPEGPQTAFPQDVMDAGNVVTREASVADASPFKSAGIDGEIVHARNYRDAEKAVSEGRPVEVPDDTFAQGSWRPGKVYASDGREVGVRYEVVEADSLVASQRADLSPNPDYPADLQPRDRTRAASAEQINEIAARLNPERLGPSPDAATGAPIVGPDNVVESGNGRWLALKGAYARDGAPGYRDWLKRNDFDVDGMKEPVLVARRVTPLSDAERVEFTTAANRASALRMSAPEQALADARLIDGAALDKLADDGVASAANRPFVKAVLAKLPQAERGGLIDRHGVLSAEGIRRVEAALLARAYGDPALLARILEDPDSGVKALAGALTDSAGKWAAMRDGVARGALPAGMDITTDLLDAFRLVAKARDTRTKIKTLVDQAEMFEAPSPVTRALLGLMFRGDGDGLTRAASRASVARGLAAYADEAAKNTTEARLFGEPLGAQEVLDTTLAKVGREDLADAAEQATLPLAARETLAKPEVDDAVVHELEHLQEGIEEPIMVPDPDGKLNADGTPVMVSAKALIAEADREIAAAENITACATGQMPKAAE